MAFKAKSDIRSPFLDRLIDEKPFSSTEPVPKRTLTRQEYRESVRRDLMWLLNTRSADPVRPAGGPKATVINYGLPDFGDFYTRSFTDAKRLAAVVKRALGAFEPRLTNVQVRVEPFKGSYKRLAVVIDAVLVMDREREPVSFPLIYNLDKDAYEDSEGNA